MKQAHGIVACATATVTIMTGWDSMISTAASVSFFVVDAGVMALNGRRLAKLGKKSDSPG